MTERNHWLRGSRQPHEVVLLIAGMILGVVGILAFDQVSSPTIRALTAPYGYVLYGGLACTSIVSLMGVFSRGVPGAVVERAGLVGMALLLIAYSGVVVGTSGFRGLSFVVFVGGFAIANIIRIVQIRAEIDQLRAMEVIIDGREERPGGN